MGVGGFEFDITPASSCTARIVIGRNFKRSKRCVSAVFFTWSVQVDPAVDTFDGRGVIPASHMTNEGAARLLAIFPERETKEKVWV